MVSTSQPGVGSARARPGMVVAILCGAPFLASLDLFVVTVAFPAIRTSFPGNSLADLSWVLSAYAIVYAALLVPLGRCADRVGHKGVFLAGLGIFILSSAGAGVSPSLWVLVGFRALQAVGAAAVIPTSLGLLLRAVPPERRAFSVKLWAAVSAVAAAAGPVLGGLLVEASWRWVFVLNIPVGLVLVLGAVRALDGYRVDAADPDLDLPGAVLLTVGIGSLTLALVQGPDWGWQGPKVLVSLALSATCLLGFGIDNSRRRTPLVARALLRVRTFAWSNVAAVVFGAGFGGGLLAMVLWLQEVWGYSALQTGLALAPGPLMVPIFAIGAQPLTSRVRPGRLAATGSLLMAAGTALVLVSVDATNADYVAKVLPGWILVGVGVGLALPTILSSATAELPTARSATGSAVVTMARQVGIALGIAVLVAVLGDRSGTHPTEEEFTQAWWAVVALSVLAAAVAPGLTPRRSPT